MFGYNEHLEKCINIMQDCVVNLVIWSGQMDDKLKVEWDAAVLCAKPTIICVVGKQTKLPDFMENHSITRRILRIDRRKLTTEDRTKLLEVLASETSKLHVSVEEEVIR